MMLHGPEVKRVSRTGLGQIHPMDLFALIVFGSLIAFVLTLLALGRFSGRRAGDITNEDRYERWAVQAEVEKRDIGEMVEGQNAYRRRRRRPPVSVAQIFRRTEQEQQGRLAQPEAKRRPAS